MLGLPKFAVTQYREPSLGINASLSVNCIDQNYKKISLMTWWMQSTKLLLNKIDYLANFPSSLNL